MLFVLFLQNVPRYVESSSRYESTAIGKRLQRWGSVFGRYFEPKMGRGLGTYPRATCGPDTAPIMDTYLSSDELSNRAKLRSSYIPL